jgi:Beta protein
MEKVESVLYMPVFKWKLGEQTATKSLSATQKAQLLPIAELQDRPYDWGTEEYSKSWDEHIDAVAKKTAEHWGKAHEIGFDQELTMDDELESNTDTTWQYLFRKLWSAGVRAVPVLSSRASKEAIDQIVAASKAHGRSRYILRYRVHAVDEEITPASLVAWFKTMLNTTGVPASDVDVVFDCDDFVSQWNLAATAPLATSLLAEVSAAASWRRVFLLSGGFPVNLAGIPKGTHQLPRHDWTFFKLVSPLAQTNGCKVLFGDYAVSHVDPFNEDPRVLKMTANLRYTHADHWHVLKGASVKDKGFDQYRDLCKLLVNLPIYLGAPFSHGDKNYNDIADDVVPGPGNATHWRRDATNHHIHVVLRQLTTGKLP